MGKAHTPYARSVQQTHPLPRNELPDAGLVFDTLLKRDKVSPVLFVRGCFAQLALDSLCPTLPASRR